MQTHDDVNETPAEQAPLPVIYTRLDQSQKAVEARDTMLALVEVLDRYTEIHDPEAQSAAVELLARGRAAVRQFDAKRKEMGEGARKVLADLNASFTELSGPVEEQLRKVESAIKAYNREVEEQRRAAEQARRDAEAAKRKAEQEEREKIAKEQGLEPPPPPPEREEAQPPAPAPTTKLAGSHGSAAQYRDNWKWRVVDIDQVPEQFLVPVEERVQKATLNAIAKSQKDKAMVPGVEFYNDPVLHTRSA